MDGFTLIVTFTLLVNFSRVGSFFLFANCTPSASLSRWCSSLIQSGAFHASRATLHKLIECLLLVLIFQNRPLDVFFDAIHTGKCFAARKTAKSQPVRVSGGTREVGKRVLVETSGQLVLMSGRKTLGRTFAEEVLQVILGARNVVFLPLGDFHRNGLPGPSCGPDGL